ncbi:MAG: hypothetical protein IT377_13245 [Polyangiaceae bacterium]|nr:hypothetical protein [Polyangiaceae bacterium]
MATIKTSSDDRLDQLLQIRLESRAEPRACAADVGYSVKPDSRDHRRLIAAAYWLLGGLGGGRPKGARRQHAVRQAATAVRSWLERGFWPASVAELRGALTRARLDRRAEVMRWERICERLADPHRQRRVRLRLLARARRKLALRRWEYHRARATHALLQMVRWPPELCFQPFVEHVSRCAATAVVAGLLADRAALGELENLAWLRAAELGVAGPGAVETAARRMVPRVLAAADQVLTDHATKAFAASAALFIEWALGGACAPRATREGACLS